MLEGKKISQAYHSIRYVSLKQESTRNMGQINSTRGVKRGKGTFNIQRRCPYETSEKVGKMFSSGRSRRRWKHERRSTTEVKISCNLA